MTPIEFLQQRNSAPKLTAPGPDDAELKQMFQSAIRAPDHARLQPWRFLVIRDDAREQLGQLMAEASAKREADLTPEQRQKIINKAQRAPLIIAVVVRYTEHPKVPEQEQLLSAGCAAMNLLLAAEALGYAAIWRTGANSFDKHVWSGLGLSDKEALIGFLYVGRRDGPQKPLPNLDVNDFITDWGQ